VTAAGKKAWRWLAGSLAALAISAALVVGLFRVAIEFLPEVEDRVTERVREATGLTISFDALDARLGRYGFEVVFEGARVVGAEHGEVLVTARAGRLSLALFRSLLHRRLEVGRFILEAPRLDFVIFPDRHIELVGQSGIVLDPDRPRQPFSLERLPRGALEIRDASLGFRDLGQPGGDFELRRVALELLRGSDHVALNGSVDLPRHLGARLDFQAEVNGVLNRTAELDWQARIEAREADFAGWAASLPAHWRLPRAGRGDLRLDADGRGLALAQASGSLRLVGLRLPDTAAGAAASYSRVAGEFTLQRSIGRWQVSARDLELSMDGQAWEPGSLEAEFEQAPDGPYEFKLKSGFLRLENLLPLLALAPPSPALEPVTALAPRGVLRRVDLTLRGTGSTGDPGLPDITGRLEFAGVGVNPLGQSPGFDGLEGRLEAEGAAGKAWLSARDLRVDWPAQWREVLAFPGVDARAGWRRVPEGVEAWAEDVQVDAGHGRATGRLDLLLRPGTTPHVKVAAEVHDFEVAASARYLLTGRLKPKPLAWLDEAFRGGRLVHAEVEIDGPARGFPYREVAGHFFARARVEGLSLHYAPGWPTADNVDLLAEFAGPGFIATDISGSIAGVRVRGARAELADWRESLLVLHAPASADAGAVQRLLARSPLGPKLGPVFARLTAAGPLDGEAVMMLPLKEFASRVITVQAMGRDLRLALAGMAEPVTSLSGQLTVRNSELYAPGLSGEWLGGRFEASVDTQPQGASTLVTRVTAAGVIDGSRLPAVVRLPLDSGLAGVTAWRGSWVATRDSAGRVPMRSTARVESDLAGLASGLPAPLSKAAATRRPLRVVLDMEQPDLLTANVSLERDLRARLEFLRGANGYAFTRGLVRLGGGEVATLPVAAGLRIDGRLPALGVTELTRLRWPAGGRRALQDWLADVNLAVGRLEVLGYDFERVTGRMRPGNRGWDIELSGPAAAGQVSLPYDFSGAAPLVLDLERLRTGERSPAASGRDVSTDPRRLPSMRIDVRSAQFERYDLGHLTAELERRADGLHLERFALQHPAFAASGNGRWVVDAAGQRGALDFELDSGNATGLLEAFGFAPWFEARETHLEAGLAWPGAPDGKLLARLSGSASLRIADGRVASVEPGAGRILGLMSLAHLPRRLSLDFHDVTDEGLAFDSITGRFVLLDGTAYTDNLTLRGPASEIGIAGRTSLGERNYDQTAVVTGQLGASLGVAGALAGGPAVGAALLLFSQIFKEPLKGAVRAYYRITGPWETPTVRKIDADELKDFADKATVPLASSMPAEAGSRP
jgi:uncharacterized protein (TIGR02099 family)